MKNKAFKKVLILSLVVSVLVVISMQTQFINAADKPTIYICGDSTAQTYPASNAPQQGWGQRISELFTNDVVFVNKAIGGRSSKSFIDEGRLNDVLKVINANDYMLIQWGINDRYKSDSARYTEPYSTFKKYLKQYIDGAKSKKAIPVLLTPTVRFDYKNSAFQNDFVDYCAATKEVATETNTLLIDVQKRQLDYMNSIGYDKSIALYKKDDVLHYNDKGAYQVARIISEGVKDLKINISSFVKNSSVK